jgi:hypothetical protein
MLAAETLPCIPATALVQLAALLQSFLRHGLVQQAAGGVNIIMLPINTVAGCRWCDAAVAAMKRMSAAATAAAAV